MTAKPIIVGPDSVCWFCHQPSRSLARWPASTRYYPVCSQHGTLAVAHGAHEHNLPNGVTSGYLKVYVDPDDGVTFATGHSGQWAAIDRDHAVWSPRDCRGESA